MCLFFVLASCGGQARLSAPKIPFPFPWVRSHHSFIFAELIYHSEKWKYPVHSFSHASQVTNKDEANTPKAAQFISG